VDTVQLLIDVLGPVVLIVATGAIVAPRLGLDATTLSKLAYWILGPAFVFNVFATTTLDADTAARLVAAGAAGVAAAAIAALMLSPLAGIRDASRSAAVMTSAYGNAGNAGLAICAFALGDDSLDRAGVLMVTIVFLGTLLGVWLGTRQTQSSIRAAAEALASPMIVAAIVGFVINLIDLDLPTMVDRGVSTIAQGLIPVMLLTLGLQLVATGSLGMFRTTSVITVAKLIVAPVVGWLVAQALGLSGDDLGVVVLQSAMPPAVFCMVLALEHDLEADRTTNDVVAVTIISLLTLPVALTLVTRRVDLAKTRPTRLSCSSSTAAPLSPPAIPTLSSYPLRADVVCRSPITSVVSRTRRNNSPATVPLAEPFSMRTESPFAPTSVAIFDARNSGIRSTAKSRSRSRCRI